MKTKILPILLLFSLATSSFISNSQIISKEVLIEDSIFRFELTFNLTQRVIDSTFASELDTENTYLFRHFIKTKKHEVFSQCYRDMLAGNMNSSLLQGIYQDAFNSIKKDTTLLTQFEDWKNGRQHVHPHSHGNKEAGADCHNIDFESGGMANWASSMGEVPCPAPGFQGCVFNVVNGTMGAGGTARHLIMSGGNDPDVPAVSRVGSDSYSLRLGDEQNGANADIVQHKFTVAENNKFYVYQFAVVFQEPPGHGLLSQPFFSIEFFDSNMNKIPTCGNYFVSNASGNPGFVDVFNAAGALAWRYKPWSKIAVDLENYVGHEVTVIYTVADCGAGGHEARAYIDGKCEEPEIVINKTCRGIQLEADSGYLHYQWFEGKNKTLLVNDTNRILDSVGPGIYYVDIISESGCTLSLDTVMNDLYILLDQEIEDKEPSCNNTLDGKITVNGFGGAPAYQYSIDNGVTFQISNEFNGLGVGTYDLILMDDSACQDTVTFDLLGPPPILPNLITENTKCFSICNGSATAFPTGGVSPNGTYRVEFNNVFSPTQSVSDLCAGAYTVKVTDEIGCLQLSPFIITEPDLEIIDDLIIKNEDCFNDCSGQVTIVDAVAVSFSIDNGFTFQPSPVFSNLCAEAGPYQAAIKTPEGCIAKAALVITKPPPLKMDKLRDTFICLNKEAIYTVNPSGGTPPYSVVWSTGQLGSILVESPKTPSNYTVKIIDSKGCEIEDDFTINLHPQPEAKFEANPGPVTDIFNTDIQFTNTTQYGAALDYEWYIDNFDFYTTTDAHYFFPQEGGKTYQTCLKVENTQGCRDSICKDLTVVHETLIYVPNAFTPNKDNVNDQFFPVIEGLETTDYSFAIYNRWGEELFKTNNRSEGWNGTYKGQKVEEEVYVWRVVGVTKATGETIEKVGHVTVLHKL